MLNTRLLCIFISVAEAILADEFWEIAARQGLWLPLFHSRTVSMSISAIDSAWWKDVISLFYLPRDFRYFAAWYSLSILNGEMPINICHILLYHLLIRRQRCADYCRSTPLLTATMPRRLTALYYCRAAMSTRGYLADTICQYLYIYTLLHYSLQFHFSR